MFVPQVSTAIVASLLGAGLLWPGLARRAGEKALLLAGLLADLASMVLLRRWPRSAWPGSAARRCCRSPSASGSAGSRTARRWSLAVAHRQPSPTAVHPRPVRLRRLA